MKIIQILPALKEGGVETGTIDLSLSLQSRGHDITVISNSDSRASGVQSLTQNGIRHLEWPVDKKNPSTIYKMSRKLRHYILENSPDIIHARSRVPAWITWLAIRKTKIKWITTCHGYYQTHLGSRVMGWANAVIVPSKTIEKHMKKDFDVPEDKMVLIWRGVDLESYRFEPKKPQKKPVIAMIGRLTPLKGHKDFLNALSFLKRKNIAIEAWIIGDQTKNRSYYDELIQIRDTLDLKEEVHFLGHQPNIPALLKKIDLVIFPSTHPESFGRTIIEAQASGVAVIASRLGGPQEIIEEGVTGLLFQPHSPPEIADTIEKILADPEKTFHMTLQARKKIEKEFSKTEMVNKTEALYRRVIEETFKKILVIKIGSLGDLILISPSLRAIRKEFPAAHLTLLTDQSSREIAAHCPWLDDILYLQKERYWSDIFKIRQRLVSRQFDTLIDFQNNRWTHAAGFLSQIPHRYGYARKWGRFCLTDAIRDRILPPVEHQFQILKQIGIHPTDDHLEFWITEQDKRNAESLLEQLGIQKPPVGIHIGSNWQTKRWRGKHIAEFARRIQKDEGRKVLLMGSEKEIPFEKEILRLFATRGCATSDFAAQDGVVPPLSAIGKTTVRELGALIQRCSFFVSSDSAPLHIAAAVGTPTIALFGPTDPFRHLPPGKKIAALSQKVDCGPCYRPYCNHHFVCMEKIDPTLVIEKRNELT